jgi:hypothetical protein
MPARIDELRLAEAPGTTHSAANHVNGTSGARPDVGQALPGGSTRKFRFAAVGRLAASLRSALVWMARVARESIQIARAGLMVSAPAAPLLAATLLLAAAVGGFEAWIMVWPSLGVGLLALLVAWITVAMVYAALGLTHVRRANATAFCELSSQLIELDGAHRTVCPTPPQPAADTPYSAFADGQRDQFQDLKNQVEDALMNGKRGRALWVFGTGYVSAWQLIHRAQEVLINIEPLPAVALRARYDWQRLVGANIANHEELCAALTGAIDFINPLLMDFADLAGIDDVLQVVKQTRHRIKKWTPIVDSTHAQRLSQELETSLHVLAGAPLRLDGKLAAFSALRELQRHVCSSNGRHVPPDVIGALGTAAIDELDKLASRLTTVDRHPADLWSQQPAPGSTGAELTAALQRPRSLVEARMVIGTVRQAINQYRDQNYGGLVRARIHLACTTVATGLIGLSALAIAIAAGVPVPKLLTGATFFVVGALVGLFSRLYAEVGSDTAIDDFGLTGTRLHAAPQLSGVAAVLGVGLLALTGMTVHGTDPLGDAFDMSKSSFNIVTAAVFGLTPGLLIDRLKQQTESLKSNLRSTQPQGNAAIKA